MVVMIVWYLCWLLKPCGIYVGCYDCVVFMLVVMIVWYLCWFAYGKNEDKSMKVEIFILKKHI